MNWFDKLLNHLQRKDTTTGELLRVRISKYGLLTSVDKDKLDDMDKSHKKQLISFIDEVKGALGGKK